MPNSSRFSRPVRRKSVGRKDVWTGALAFGALVLLGGGVGILGGRLAARNLDKRVASDLYAQATSTANDLGRGLEDRRQDLRLLAEMPMVIDHSPLQGKAYDGFVKLYPEFESVSVGTPTAMRNGTVRLEADLEGRTERAYGTFAKGWADRVVSRAHRFGVHPEASVVLLAPSGRQSPGLNETPSWDTLASSNWRAAILKWPAKERTMVAKAFVPETQGSSSPLLVAAMKPMSEIADVKAAVEWQGFGVGLTLGVFAGLAAWLAIVRATKGLRRVNAALERRVARRTERLAEAERSFRGIFENVPLGLYECDAKGCFVRVNPHLARTLGYDEPVAMMAAIGSLQALGEPEKRIGFLDRLRLEGEARTTTFASRADGARLWLDETARAVVRDGQLVIEGAIHDATAQRELEERLRTIGATDPLTGLLNRRGMEEAFERLELPASFIVLDLDNFKGFNDTYGHPAGDAALQRVAQALRDTVRTDDFAARAGGEEFIVILPRTNAAGARRVAEALRAAVAACDILETRLTISGGVATASQAEEFEEALAAADRALYQAKQAGRNRIVVNPAKLV